jgi:hypothetical protein
MEFIGVKSFQELITASVEGEQVLKREALIFDRIGISDLNHSKKDAEYSEYLGRNKKDLNWLQAKGVVFDPEDELKDKLLVITEQTEFYHRAYHAYFDVLRDMERRKRKTTKQRTKFISHSTQTFRIDTMLATLNLRNTCGFDAYPVFYQSALFPEFDKPSHNVVQVVLNALPTPDEQTSWEHILEYRSDPDSHHKFLALRDWMSEMTRANLPALEIEQKLEYLMSQYQQHMRLHKMKTNTGVLETVLVGSGEFFENLIKIQWGKLAKSLFAFKHRKIVLLENELVSPGREVAYIIKSRKRFED